MINPIYSDLTQFEDPLAIGWGVTSTDAEEASPVLRQGSGRQYKSVVGEKLTFFQPKLCIFTQVSLNLNCLRVIY